jgi:hypothetical protein
MQSFPPFSASVVVNLRPLTPQAFYDLVYDCQQFSQRLVNLDPLRVDLESCYRFNRWLPHVKSYHRLAQRCHSLRLARPIARWQLMTLGCVTWLILLLALPGRFDRLLANLILYGWVSLLFILWILPQRYYGTTVEILEGRLLFLVDALNDVLDKGETPVSEAVFFQTRAMLENTRRDLRQQLDLVHRRDS